MGSSQQLYSLSWGEFGTSLVSTVQLLRCHQDLVDVTLAAGGRSFPAHKLVLSAASPFLLSLLKSTPCKHPVLLLAGITAADLEALLEFVYRGEVSIDPNQLPSLLQAAHCLNIQGLAPGAISAEKPDDLSASVTSNHDVLTRDVINSFLPIRRRKRAKRRNSTGSGMSPGGKWPHLDNTSSDPENRHGVGVPMVSNQNVLGISDMSRKDDDDSSSHTTDDNCMVMAGSASGGKIRGASDQPGACPLCGAMLRQARNLRRHLLTSCKHRTMNPAMASLPSATLSSLCSEHEKYFPAFLERNCSISPSRLQNENSSSSEHIECEVSPITSPFSLSTCEVSSSEKAISPHNSVEYDHEPLTSEKGTSPLLDLSFKCNTSLCE